MLAAAPAKGVSTLLQEVLVQDIEACKELRMLEVTWPNAPPEIALGPSAASPPAAATNRSTWRRHKNLH